MLEVNPFWSMVLLLGVIGWISTAIIFIFQAWDHEDNFNPRRALIWGVTFVVFYGVWILGLVNA